MASVTIRNLTKKFGDITAVNNVNLDINDGEFVVFIGASGCGKTTTLNMIAGLEEATSGEILIGSENVVDLPPKDRDVAMVFQNYALYPHMTVSQNMAFGLKMRKFPKDQIEQRVKEAAGILGLEDLLARKPKELSGGQRQRVAVGRAIVRKPKVFLFDEPLSNLDARLRVMMRAELSRLHDKLGTTMIYVTHDQVEAMGLADKLVIIDQGVCQQVGKPLELFDEPANAFVAGFIGSPPMNLVKGLLDKKDEQSLFLKLEGGTLDLPQEYTNAYKDWAGKEVIFGIRPQDMTPLPEDASLPVLSMNVDVVEPLGSTTQLTLNFGQDIFTVATEKRQVLKSQETIPVGLDLSKMHLFSNQNDKPRIPR